MSKNAARISKKQIKAEILKSGRDPVYFINNYVKTVHPVRGAVPFKTYPFQTELLKEFQNKTLEEQRKLTIANGIEITNLNGLRNIGNEEAKLALEEKYEFKKD